MPFTDNYTEILIGETQEIAVSGVKEVAKNELSKTTEKAVDFFGKKIESKEETQKSTESEETEKPETPETETEEIEKPIFTAQAESAEKAVSLSPEEMKKLKVSAAIDIETMDIGLTTLCQFLRSDFSPESEKRYGFSKEKKERLTALLAEVKALSKKKSNPKWDFWKAFLMSTIPTIVILVKDIINSKKEKEKQAKEQAEINALREQVRTLSEQLRNNAGKVHENAPEVVMRTPEMTITKPDQQKPGFTKSGKKIGRPKKSDKKEFAFGDEFESINVKDDVKKAFQ